MLCMLSKISEISTIYHLRTLLKGDNLHEMSDPVFLEK